MSRPRDFDADAVLEQVTNLFTQSGYHGTSIAALTQATGLGKQSLYNSFGDKEALYLKAVDFAAGRWGQAIEAMNAAPSGRAAVNVFFEVLLAVCSHPDACVNNCIVSAGILEGVEIPSLAEQLKSKWQATQRMLQGAVERGQKDGSVRSDVPSKELAGTLITLMSGLRVSARAMDDKKQLTRVMHLSLSVLDHPAKAARRYS